MIFSRIRSLLKKDKVPPKKAISTEDLGSIIFNHARLNSVYMIENLDNKFDAGTKGWLFLYGVCYSICLQTRELLKVYGESAALEVLSRATKSLQRFIVHFTNDEKLSSYIPDEIDSIFKYINTVLDSEEPYPIVTIANSFSNDAIDRNKYDCSAELRMEIRTYVASWIKLASSLTEEYELIISTDAE